ncbi:small subunit ribosomal protein S13 [Thermotomaculum hydrothermale]|uniref:Small ribosomal subunit protein uS13 n=1 Tax=Thermotomaculum hydrothermale TaxID=981385 RepID=A0A7R6PRB1_9BACT|nr:30S ribosomal protein S13 [Thermotomaculum hydrothermale]BBB32906.1 small subunit ribosomal protein S13 [Thermotomaculum hydrothermale]
MVRIAGVDLPENKRAEIALTYIFGIGRTRANEILEKAGIDKNRKMKDLTMDEVNTISKIIQNEYVVEGDLRKKITMDIKRLMEINCYRGIRHKRRMPVRGQRTHTNARTARGKRSTGIGKKKKSK